MDETKPGRPPNSVYRLSSFVALLRQPTNTRLLRSGSLASVLLSGECPMLPAC